MNGLRVLAEARWPTESGPDEPPPVVAGYLLSTFNPLVADVAERCLGAHHGERPAPPAEGADTAIVLVSASGDATSAEHVAATVDDGRSVGPLFFFQSVPNSIAGYVAARWGLGGPLTCLCPTGDAMTDGLDQARLLLDDGAARSALVICVEQGGGPNGIDSAAAVLVSCAGNPPSNSGAQMACGHVVVSPGTTPVPGPPPPCHTPPGSPDSDTGFPAQDTSVLRRKSATPSGGPASRRRRRGSDRVRPVRGRISAWPAETWPTD